MYTETNLYDDLVEISKSYFIKYALLKDVTFNKLSKEEFTYVIDRSDVEIDEIIEAIEKVQQKVKENGGKLDEDPVQEAMRLRKEGKIVEAYNKIMPSVKLNKNDEKTNINFAWIMYEFLKSSESDIEKYEKNLKVLNQYVSYDLLRRYGDNATVFFNSLLWSIIRVTRKEEEHSNVLFAQFMIFINDSPAFMEKRNNVQKDSKVPSPIRTLIELFCDNLNNCNLFLLFDVIGLEWFDSNDYKPRGFVNNNGDKINMAPFAEKILNNYAKKLIESDKDFTLQERINVLLPKLKSVISKFPEYEWLPYYRIKLLVKIDNKETALLEATDFARKKGNVAWIWGILCDLVKEEDVFNSLCAGILCNASAETKVGLQRKVLPYLIEKDMYGEAKYVLDELIKTYTIKDWVVSHEISEMKSSTWYIDNKTLHNLDALQPYASEAYKLIYKTMPYTDALITHINESKGIINFIYKFGRISKEGFFYADMTESKTNLEVYSPVKIQMTPDNKYENLFRVYSVEKGDKEIEDKFVKNFSGIFTKVKDFGFINGECGEIYINSSLVEKNNLVQFCTVTGRVLEKWDKSKRQIVSQVISIENVVEPNADDIEKVFCDEIEITDRGFGFIDSCFVPEPLISNNEIKKYDRVEAKARKSWNVKKGEWSWTAYEILSVGKEDSFGGLQNNIDKGDSNFAKIDYSDIDFGEFDDTVFFDELEIDE